MIGALRYAAVQIARFALLMVAVSIVTFALVSASPIDPVQANTGQAALLSMSALPQLTAPVPKLLLCAAASLPLVSAPRDLPRALLSLLAARGIETLRTADGTVRVTLSGGGVEAELLPD